MKDYGNPRQKTRNEPAGTQETKLEFKNKKEKAKRNGK
jgi:hypothetical protein